MLLVPSKSENNKKLGIAIDFRKLNESVVNDKFSRPNITNILDSLSGAVNFSHLDLISEHYQLNLENKSRKFTAFTTRSGQYPMTRQPNKIRLPCLTTVTTVYLIIISNYRLLTAFFLPPIF